MVWGARPVSDEFGRLGPDKGTSIVWGGGQAKEAGAAAARAVEGVSECRPRISHCGCGGIRRWALIYDWRWTRRA